MSYRQAIVMGVALGLVAACVVWWLERFEVGRLHGEIRSYLGKYDEFRAWESERGGGS